MVTGSLTVALGLWLAAASAQDFHVYVGDVTADSVLIAWGTTRGDGNTIGRDSRSHGAAELRLGDRTVRTERNWAEVTGLKPDTSYNYEVIVGGKRIGGDSVRTWPERARRMVFFVIGDYGTASYGQRRIAEVMWEHFQKREAAGDPVRFVLTVGDNIYADLNLIYTSRNSGDRDRHWESKFFKPYSRLIARIPFRPTLGNHDGNASESHDDLAVYLDNFFFPGNRPARWYRFSFGGLADFFGLDSTDNTLAGRTRPVYRQDGEQFAWMREVFAASRAPWKIPYFHNPPFNAGPRHGADLASLSHWVDLFQKSGVKVSFAGHEHNFQFSERNPQTREITFVISGAGGELRKNSTLDNMRRAQIAGWSGQHHFLEVEIEADSMHISPVSYEKLLVRDASGQTVRMPLVVGLK